MIGWRPHVSMLPRAHPTRVVMSVRIAVLDPLPGFRRGIREMLGVGGFEPQAPDDLLTWLHEEDRRVVLLTLQSPEDWSLLERLREHTPQLLIVAVLTEAVTSNYVRAIMSGASAVMPRDAQPELVQRVFEDAVGGKCLLPIEVVQALASSSSATVEDDLSRPSPQEVQWLRQLSQGVTVSRLASAAGYSERAMFRLLRELYRRIGARNRTEALLYASQRGWL
jgi:DNA-binding NarL/FixJ family response regulator